MANQGRWQEQDRYRGGRDGGRPGGGEYGRDFGAPYRGRGYERDEPGRRPAESYGAAGYNAINTYGSNYLGDRPGGEWFDRPRGAEGYRTDSGWQRDSAFDRQEWADRNARYGRDEGRGWWDRATDEVSSWFGDQDAGRRRFADETEGRHRGRGPKGYTRTDDRIREEVCDRLSDDPYVDASEIEVSVAGGEVTLTGTADSREERRRAEDCAERVSGVGHVQNNVRVNARTSYGYGESRSGYAEDRSGSGDAHRPVTSSSAASGRSVVNAGSDPYSRGSSTGATSGSPAIDVSGQR